MSFLRKATGLVREAGFIDVFAMASLNMQLAFGIMYLLMWGPYMYPGGDLITSTIICTIGSVFMAVTWAMMASIMPRSGGDYVFISRSLHPLLGFLSSLAWVIANFFWFGILTAWVADPGLSTLCLMLGYTGAANWFASTTGMLVTGTILIVLSWLLMSLGPKYWLRFNVAAFILGCVMIVLVFGLIVGASPSSAVAAFNAHAVKHGALSFQATINEASSALQGARVTGIGQTLNLIPVAAWGLVYAYFATYIAGEVKKVHRNYLVALPGVTILSGVLMISSAWLYISKYGYDFLYSIVYLWSDTANYAFPVSPSFHMIASTLTTNQVIIALIGIGFVCWTITMPLFCLIGQSRIALSWAFDRIAPAFFGDVNERYHSPIKNLTFFAIMGEIFLILYVFYLDIIGGFAPFLIQAATTFIMIAIAAMVLPFRKGVRHIYEAAPVSKYKVLGIPVLTLIAIPYFVFYAVLVYYGYTRPELGYVHTPSIIGVVVALLGGAAYFIATWYYRKGQGIDLGKLYKEIPVE